MAVAFGVLMHAFIVSDFSVANVAMNSHTEKPLLYRVAGTWGSHEGSILLWCLALTGFGAALAGLGLVLLPEFIVGPALQRGELVTVLDSFHPPSLALNAVYPQHRQRSEVNRQFLAFLQARLLT